MSKGHLWLDAFYSVSLQLKAECEVVLLALDDLAKDGADRLVALLVGKELSKLRIINGTSLQCEITLPQMAVAMCTLGMEGSAPSIVVGAGSSLYIYKHFKPYYKYTVPQDGANYAEEAHITQLASLPRSSADVSTSSLLLVGTDHKSLLIIDPQSFTAIGRVELPGTAMIIKCSGYYDVEATILVATFDAELLLLQSTEQPMVVKSLLTCGSLIVDVAFNGSVIAVATSDRCVRFYTVQGHEMRKVAVDTFILSIAWVESKHHDLSLFAVSLANGSVLFYRQGSVVESLHFTQDVVAMIWGRFGREDGVLTMITREGDLVVKILNRGFKLPNPIATIDSLATSAPVNKQKQLWPAKTKIFVEQALREQEDPQKMHQQFQESKCRVHLRALKEFLDVSENETSEALEPDRKCVHLSAKLVGHGSRSQLQLLVQNTSDQIIDSLTVMLHATDGKLVVEPPCKKINLIFPSVPQWVTVDVNDPFSQGGQISIIVAKDADLDDESSTARGFVVYSANVNVAPII